MSDLVQRITSGMITLRGDLASSPIMRAAGKVPGIGQITAHNDTRVAWMSPDELLVLVPYDDLKPRLTTMQNAASGSFALAVDMSDARAMFRVTGPSPRETLAKLTPADMSPDAFKSGQIRRTRLAQTAAAMWITDEGAIEIICFRSVADYVHDVLANAANPAARVGFFHDFFHDA